MVERVFLPLLLGLLFSAPAVVVVVRLALVPVVLGVPAEAVMAALTLWMVHPEQQTLAAAAVVVVVPVNPVVLGVPVLLFSVSQPEAVFLFLPVSHRLQQSLG